MKQRTNLVMLAVAASITLIGAGCTNNLTVSSPTPTRPTAEQGSPTAQPTVQNNVVSQPQAAATPQPSQTAVALITNGTENWKTYRNTAIGFEVSYPSNWTVEDKGVESAGIWINPPDFKIPQSGTVVPYFVLVQVAHEPAVNEKPSAKTFGVRVGNVYTKGNVVFFPNVKGTAGGYEIQYRAGVKEVEQMLTTFKFFSL